MSTFGHRCNVFPVILAIGLCAALTACEPNQAQQQAAKPVERKSSQVSVLQQLDTAARTAERIPSKLCNLEFMDGTRFGGDALTVRNSTQVEFRGWVGDETNGKRPANARLRFATPNHYQAWESPIGVPVSRKDVAKYVNIPTLEDAGFKTTLDLTPLPQGEYRVYLVFDGASDAYRCDNGRRILR